MAGDGLSGEAETYPSKVMMASGHACTWRNVALSGALTTDVLASQTAILDSYSQSLGPKVYVLWIGTNDLMYRPEPVDAVWRKVRLAVEAAAKRGWKVAIATATPRVQAPRPDQAIEILFSELFNPSSFESRRSLFNTLIRNNAAAYRFSLVDFAANQQIGYPNTVTSDKYLRDRTHFSSSGTDVLARLTTPVLTALLGTGL